MLDALTERYETLDEATFEVVRAITNLAATMKVLEAPDPHATAESLEASETTLEALAGFLEQLGATVQAAQRERLEAERLDTWLEQREPTPGQAEAEPGETLEGRNPFEEVPPLRRLSAPYSVLLNLERDLYAQRIRRPYRLRKLKEIWGDLGRIGSTHPSDGLTARLGRLTEYVDEAVGGRQADAPWSDDDIDAVRQLARRTADIAAWTDDELAERERQAWVERVRDWVETAEEEPESAAHMTEMLTRFLTDVPRDRQPDVRMLLERITELESIPSRLRKRAREQLEKS